ncbi:MAG: aminoacyl-tRNA hydrolase [Bacteroidetes bacterium]|nr:aminoacyl-tRNA hydrolase [Bacteroidota bacterium]
MVELLISEVTYRFSRSSGPGGQSVNKVSTQVELLFDVGGSNYLTDDQKTILSEKLTNRINSEGILIIKSDETRSQLKNREIVINRFLELVKEAFKPIKKRRATKPTRSSVEKRLTSKKIQSDKKRNRKVDED